MNNLFEFPTRTQNLMMKEWMDGVEECFFVKPNTGRENIFQNFLKRYKKCCNHDYENRKFKLIYILASDLVWQILGLKFVFRLVS